MGHECGLVYDPGSRYKSQTPRDGGRGGIKVGRSPLPHPSPFGSSSFVVPYCLLHTQPIMVELRGKALIAVILAVSGLDFLLFGYDQGLFGGILAGQGFQEVLGNP